MTDAALRPEPMTPDSPSTPDEGLLAAAGPALRNLLLRAGVHTPEDLRIALASNRFSEMSGVGRKKIERLTELCRRFLDQGGLSRAEIVQSLEADGVEARAALRSTPLRALGLPSAVEAALIDEDILIVGDLLWSLRLPVGQAPPPVEQWEGELLWALGWEPDAEPSPAPDASSPPPPATPEVVIQAPEEGPPPDLIAIVRRLTGGDGPGFFPDRDLRILRGHHGLDDESLLTFTSLGGDLGVSRERIRQLHDRALRRLEEVLRKGKLSPRFHSGSPLALQQEFEWLCGMVRGEMVGWESELTRSLEERWARSIPPAEQPYLRLLLTCAGLRGYAAEQLGVARDDMGWIDADLVSASDLRRTFVTARGVLETTGAWQSLSEVREALESESGTATSLEMVEGVCRAIGAMEVKEGGWIRLGVAALRGVSPKVHRVLLDAGEPLHLNEILERLNLGLMEAGTPPMEDDVRPIQSALTRSPWFEPISRSGFWKSSDWKGISTDAVPEIIARVLKENPGPLAAQEVVEKVHEERPWVAESSVPAYLSGDPRFERRREGWVLAEAHPLESVTPPIQPEPVDEPEREDEAPSALAPGTEVELEAPDEPTSVEPPETLERAIERRLSCHPEGVPLRELLREMWEARGQNPGEVTAALAAMPGVERRVTTDGVRCWLRD